MKDNRQRHVSPKSSSLGQSTDYHAPGSLLAAGRLARPLAVILLLVLLAQPLTAAAFTPFTAAAQYQGVAGAGQLVHQRQFNDIGGHWAAAAILETAVLGLFSGSDSQTFSPDRAMTRYEMLLVLLRAQGQDEALQAAMDAQEEQQVAGITVISRQDRQRQAVIELAGSQGIITQEERDTIEALSEEARLAIDEEVQEAMAPYVRSLLTSPQLTELEAALLQQRLQNHGWQQAVTRQQAAAWLARTLNLAPVPYSQAPRLNQFTDAEAIAPANRPLVEAVLQAGIINGTSPTTFHPNQSLTRGQMAALLHAAGSYWHPLRGLTRHEGQVADIAITGSGSSLSRQITLQHTDGSAALLHATPSLDIPVLRRTTLGLTHQLFAGDPVYWYSNPGGTARLVVLAGGDTPENAQPLTGFLESLDPATRSFRLRDFSGREHQLQAAPTAGITINQQPTPFEQLPYGIEITVTRQGTLATRLDATLDEDPARHGYIPPGSRFIVGDTLFYDGKTIEITQRGTNQRGVYHLTPRTILQRSGEQAQLFELKVGDRVILEFDDITSTQIALLRVEDNERHITGLIRGTIDSVDQRAREVILRDIQTYTDHQWVTDPTRQLVRYKTDNALLYDGGTPVTLAQLHRQAGTRIYAATENSYGTNRIARLLIQRGSAQQYDSTIGEVEFATESMVVNYNHIQFHPGTIVVKQGRLVDRLNLEENQHINLMTVMSANGREAALVEILDQGHLEPRPGDTRLVIYQARIAEIRDYQVAMGRTGRLLDYYQLAENRWRPLTQMKRLGFSDDTLIYDAVTGVREPANARINSQVFLQSRYLNPEGINDDDLRERIRKQHFINKTGYFVVRQTAVGNDLFEEVLALNITGQIAEDDEDLDLNHPNAALPSSLIGVVKQVDQSTYTLTLENRRSWNAVNKRWEPVTGDENLNLRTAVILINDRPATPAELWRIGTGARVYLIQGRTTSANDTAYVVVVEQ